jgi:uncharacterized protein (DUF2252 family)
VPPDASKAFVSYSRDDSEFAIKLADDLKAGGANVWIDQRDIRPGERWVRAVQDALTNSPSLLVILSPSSVTSTNVDDEVSFAIEEHKTVIPVFWKDCKVPFQLRPFQYVDFRTDYDRGLKVLLKALGVDQHAQRMTPTPAPPAPESRSEVPDTKVPATRPSREQAGQALRSKLKRTDQAYWDPKGRKYNIVDLLLTAQQGRIPELLPIKWRRMAVSPYGFFRGAVPLMAADLALLPHTGIEVQICGDAHVNNIGAFGGGPDGHFVFNINDLEETIIGPWEWDVKRMSASLVLAGREAANTDKLCRDAVLAFANHYRTSMRLFSELPVVELARYLVMRNLIVSPLRSVLRKTEISTPFNTLRKLTVSRDHKYAFRKPEQPLPYHMSQEESADVLASLRLHAQTLQPERAHFFSRYEVEDVAFRVVGTSGVGLRDYMLLMFGVAVGDPLFLQIKEVTKSSYASYLPHSPVASHQGKRVVEGIRAMQVQFDPFLGWTSIAGRDYVVRQLRDHKAGTEAEDLRGEGLLKYAELGGELLSLGHARSGDLAAIAAYLGTNDKFDQAMAAFGVNYADQTAKDWEELKTAIHAGKLDVVMSAPRAKSTKRK